VGAMVPRSRHWYVTWSTFKHRSRGRNRLFFSAWADSLFIIEHALLNNNVSCLRVDSGNKAKQTAAHRFSVDPSLHVFLLHGERENVGLNLTCARRVFLVEPVVNHAFEVQAISRIDRLGQAHPTEVYCYFIADTVEENILHLGASKGHSLYTHEKARGTVHATSNFLGEASKVDAPQKKALQKGDFVAKADDLIAVLFPNSSSVMSPVAGTVA